MKKLLLLLILPVTILLFSGSGNAARAFSDSDYGADPNSPGCILRYDTPDRLLETAKHHAGSISHPTDFDACVDAKTLAEAVARNKSGNPVLNYAVSIGYQEVDCNAWCIQNGEWTKGECMKTRPMSACGNEKMSAICRCSLSE